MAGPLQNRANLKKLHIVLFLFVIFIANQSYAQSLLLPGDIVFVSVSSTSDTFEIIPLITIEKGTEFSVASGIWENDAQSFSEVEILEVKLLDQVTAGTPIRIGEGRTPNLEVNGKISLSEESEQLFIYQKEKDFFRFISAVGWGDRLGKRDRSFFGSEIPEALIEHQKSVLRLGNNSNYQYYIRNGASGTPKMLLEFVGNPGFWRGNNEKGFPAFGTSFKILSPPVILFDQSLTSTKENKKNTSIDIAIYEHDGSKLTVDIVFDSVYSSLNRQEIEGFKFKRINFTGLIGNAIYEVEIPIKNDTEYEGIETGIFNLENLSKGRFGDFITHTVLVSDDEVPEMRLEISGDLGPNILMIHNLESKMIDLRNWELIKGETKIIFPRDTYLNVGESLVLIAEENYKLYSLVDDYFTLDEDESKILNSSGLIQLKDQEGKKISELSVSKNEEISSNTLNEKSSNSIQSNTGNLNNSTIQTELKEIQNPGWKSVMSTEVNTEQFPEVDFYYWDEKETKFQKMGETTSEAIKNPLLVGYFNEPSSSRFTKEVVGSINDNSNQELFLSISSTDSDKNGRIQGSEGLNLVLNSFNKAVLADQFIRFLNDKLELKEGVQIFRSSKDFGNVFPVERDEFISPGEIFWLKLNSEVDSYSSTINIDELAGYTISNENEEDEIEKGLLEFEVKGNSNSSVFHLSFISDEVTPANEQSLKLKKELYLSDFNEVVLNGFVSENYVQGYEISRSSENITQIPLHFTSSKSGEFELIIKNWTDIPDGWVIKIEDQKEAKSYEIDENWSFKFNYADISEIDSEENHFPSVEERFVLRVIPESMVAVDEDKDLPVSVELRQNYPNPFNPTTIISFFMPEEGEAKLSVFNIVGQPVAVLLQEKRGRGEHTLEWDASDMPSGIYIYQLEVGTKIMTRKMTLVK